MWLIWLGIAVVAVIAEVLSLQFVLLMVGVGALGAAATDALGFDWPPQVLVFAVLTVACLVFGRPRLLAWSHRTPASTTNIFAMVGREAVTITEVNEAGGRVRVGGEVWTARTGPDSEPLAIGIHVTIEAIDGATAVVGLPKGN